MHRDLNACQFIYVFCCTDLQNKLEIYSEELLGKCIFEHVIKQYLFRFVQRKLSNGIE